MTERYEGTDLGVFRGITHEDTEKPVAWFNFPAVPRDVDGSDIVTPVAVSELTEAGINVQDTEYVWATVNIDGTSGGDVDPQNFAATIVSAAAVEAWNNPDN